MKRVYSTFDAFVSLKDVYDEPDFKKALDLFCVMKRSSFRELAEQTGYSYMHFLNTISGRYDITLKFAKRLSKVIGIDTLDLLKKYMDTYEKEEQ